MIDTLKIDLNEFSVLPDHALTIQPAKFIPKTGELIGNYPLFAGCEGSHAFYNAEHFNLSLKPIGTRVHAFVQMSLPKREGPNNFEPITKQRAVESFQRLESELREIGIAADVQAAGISRLDTFKNVETVEPFSTYQPVFALLDAKRVRSSIDYGGTGFLWKNTQQQFCAYDKIAEMHFNKRDVSAHQGKNVIRFEHRLLNADKILTATRLDTVRSLVNRYEDLPGIYRQTMRSNLFKFSPSDIEILSTKQLESILVHLRKLYPRSYLSRMERLLSVKGLAQFGSIETFAGIVEKVSGNKGTASKVRARMKQNTLLLSELSEQVTTKPVSELYAELHAKVLRLAA